MSSGYTTKLDYKPAPPGFGKPLAPGTPPPRSIADQMADLANTYKPTFLSSSTGTPLPPLPSTPPKSNKPSILTRFPAVTPPPRVTPAPGVSVQPGGKRRRNTKRRRTKRSRKHKSRRMR